MDFIKSFLSHLLAFILFIAVLFLSLTCISKEVITYHNLYNALEDSKLLDNELKNNERLKELGIPDELYEYIEINDLLYEFFTNKFLYEAKVIDTEPTLDKKEINERIELGLEKYIDTKIKEYTGDIDEFISGIGLDSKVKEQVKKYIEEETKIDLSNNEYVSDREIKYIELYADEFIEDIKESTYVFDIMAFIYNDTYMIIYIVIIVVAFTLITLINLNILPAVSLSIPPVLINMILFVVLVLGAIFINFGGSPTSIIINSLFDDLSVVAFKYFIIFVIIFIFMLMLQLIIKLINARLLKKKGITTEDNVLDNYDELDKKEEKE